MAAAITAVLAGVGAVAVAPQPAAAAGAVYLQLLWIRCQNDTGEWGSDEIWVEVNGVAAGLFLDFDVRERRDFVESTFFHPRQQMIAETVQVTVWEKDDTPSFPGDWDFQGRFTVNQNLVNTGEHEGYAFDDGEYIVRYRVVEGGVG
jgi:hypothetical protein